MSTTVKTRLVKIGNSHGIRIPKLLIDEVGLQGEVEVEACADHLVIRPAHPPRHGWDEQFQAMAQAGDDRLLEAEPLAPTQWEETEWEW